MFGFKVRRPWAVFMLPAFALVISSAVRAGELEEVECSNELQISICKLGCSGGPCTTPCVTCPANCLATSVACHLGCGFSLSCHNACTNNFNSCNAGCSASCTQCNMSCGDACDRKCVVCDANGPYNVDCEGETTSVPLDGSGSSDPEGGELRYEWSVICTDSGASVDNPNAVSPMVTLERAPTCPWACIVGLKVSDQDGGQAICGSTISIADTSEPTVRCPEPITLPRGDKICNSDVEEWLNSFEARDGCSGDGKVKTWNDAPECGFAPGTTTEVTFFALDNCLNLSKCKSTITIDPAQRVSSDQKGSLLVFSKIEIKWNADGRVIQDTFVDVSNDADEGSVDVQAYFINGDLPVEEEEDAAGNIIKTQEPGWNTADCRFLLTKNQPHFWSAANGSSKCQPFGVLDMDGPGRLDPESNDGSRILRGFVVMWAVGYEADEMQSPPGYWNEIRWNDLKGDAILVNYLDGTAWEYNAWAYQNTCVGHGEEILDCVHFDHNGTCCEAYAIEGELPMDGFSYDINFDELLLDFYSSGSMVFTRSGTPIMVDTDLTLHSMDIDVRQDGDGPVLTKAEFEIFNQNESKFSGTRRCICCWDQTMLSSYVRNVTVPNHFLRSKLGTDKGYARIDAVDSNECDYEEICGTEERRHEDPDRIRKHEDGTAILGLAAKVLRFTGSLDKKEWAGTNLIGVGEQSATIEYDTEVGTGEIRDTAPVAPTAEGVKPTTPGPKGGR